MFKNKLYPITVMKLCFHGNKSHQYVNWITVTVLTYIVAVFDLNLSSNIDKHNLGLYPL